MLVKLCVWLLILNRMVSSCFPLFSLGNSTLQYVSSFRYLRHIISDTLCDIEDIQREIMNMFFRTNVLIRKFIKCSHVVKCTLFGSYCLSLYDIGLWHKYTVTSINKFKSCYNQCLKSFFGYRRSYSLTQVLIETGLPCFETVMHNCSCIFDRCWQNCPNAVVFIIRLFALHNIF